MARIDTHTVDELQLYAPRASKVDWTTVKGKILSGEVFSNFSRSERASIWENLRSKEACDGIIPSLHTFFRDISYLELCANAVKRLVVLNKQRPTVRSALVHSFRPRHGDGDYLVQTSETTFRRQRGSTTECITSGYRQIWMYAMRHYPDMAKDVQCGHLKANPARAKARAKADESVIHDMAALAQKLGFRTPQIKEILKQSPDRQIARATLLKARKPDRYHYDSETFESLVDRIVGCFVLAIPNESQPTMALVTGQAPKLHDRCGTPQEQAQKLDRPHLFMDRLHAETVRQKNLSSLEVRRCVYYAFFGKPASATSTQSTMLGHSPGSEPLSPLFLPNDDSAIESESGEEITSRRSLDRGSVYGRRDRPERHRERLRNREERRHRQHGCEQRSQQSAVHTSSPPGKPLPRTSTDEGSDVSEPIRMDIFESSDLEDLEPQPGIHTSSPPGDPLPRNSTGEGSDVSEPICMDISESSDSGDPEPQPGAHTSSPPREPSYPTSTGERSDVNEPIRMDIFESSDSEDLGPQPGVQSDVGIKERERTESDEDELGREEQKRREREPLLRGAEEQVENERFECKVVETEQGLLVREELSDGERQRDDAKDDAHVTQQEGNERATVAKALLADHQGLRTEEDLMVPAATAKEVEELLNEMLQGKSGLRAANEDASVPEEQVSLERADALARLESKAEALTVELEDMVEGSNEIVSSVGGRLSPVHSEGTTETAGAAELGPSRQVQERHVASLPGPEQAHKEAVERRAAEESLFDGPLTEDQTIEEAQENEPIGTAAVPSKRKRSSSLRHEQDAQIRVREIKAVRESKRVKQSQVGESGTPGASQVELAFPLRAVNLEERVSEGLESTASGPGSHEQPDNRPEVPAPLAPESRDGELPHDVPPGQRVTLTFHAYDSGRWTRTDTVSVSLDNPTEAQIIADRYARDRSKNARFYDEGLRKVAADECVRAAIVDGSFKILMSFGKDLVVTRFLVASVKQLLQK